LEQFQVPPEILPASIFFKRDFYRKASELQFVAGVICDVCSNTRDLSNDVGVKSGSASLSVMLKLDSTTAAHPRARTQQRGFLDLVPVVHGK
jgi:hypothetical protein